MQFVERSSLARGAARSSAARSSVSKSLLDLEAPAFVAAREGGRIEDDCVEDFAAAREAGKDVEHIVGEKAMPGGVEAVEGEVLPAAIERLFREIDADRLRAAERRGDGK